MESTRTDLQRGLHPALRPHWSERALVFATPAALATALASAGGPVAGAIGGVVGAGLGVGAALFASGRTRARLALIDEARREAVAGGRDDLRAQISEIVAEAARTGAEFERRAVYAEDARRAQNRLLAELAPEFYALLRSMGHHAEQLRGLELEPEDEHAAEALCDATSSMRRLLGAVLDLARARAGKLRLRERDFDLAAALDRIARSFDPAARNKGLEYRITVGRMSNHWRFGDERRLQQVVERLLSAALDTCERGSIELDVAEDAERPDRMVFVLNDSAPVHDQASFERLLGESPTGFDNLFELDASLSLALARGLVEVLGGELEASARAEGGHTIRVVLPLPIGSDPRSEPEVASADGVGLRAVVAVPASPDGDLVESVASGLGWIVARATDVDAVDAALAESGGCDVLVVSAALDDGAGPARLADWLERWPGSVGTLLLSGGVAVDPRQLASCGAHLCLSTPLHPGRLRDMFVDLAFAGALAPVRTTRVLLATDDDDAATQETAALVAQGHTVDRVTGFDELLEAFQDAVYGLIVVDPELVRSDEDGAPSLERLEALRGLSAGPFKIRVLENGQEEASHDRSTRERSEHETSSATDRWTSGPTSQVRTQDPETEVIDPQSAEAAVDKAVLESLRELGGEDEPGLVRELIELFFGDTPARLEALRAAVARDDFEEAQRIAHALKSSCGNLGATVLSDLCRAIEDSCRRGSVDSVPSLVDRSTAEYIRVVDALSDELR
ncbi:Signal transduction histidine-protein kinase BarA [Planctomycetes bacterium Pla163]|uniref:Signal transduction histidine-protein kinase BarA n=1 Tax=Rohdeia mirabilis TaxID=2528008 RepID=A0A518D3Y2_9BACT|nr:Signal transduction histidine-protein kinase BarA [Planctomycetes bacterium Pla163]